MAVAGGRQKYGLRRTETVWHGENEHLMLVLGEDR